jgi:hypothetical protein
MDRRAQSVIHTMIWVWYTSHPQFSDIVADVRGRGKRAEEPALDPTGLKPYAIRVVVTLYFTRKIHGSNSGVLVGFLLSSYECRNDVFK